MKALTRITTRAMMLISVGLPLIPVAAGPCSGLCDPHQRDSAAGGTKPSAQHPSAAQQRAAVEPHLVGIQPFRETAQQVTPVGAEDRRPRHQPHVAAAGRREENHRTDLSRLLSFRDRRARAHGLAPQATERRLPGAGKALYRRGRGRRSGPGWEPEHP